MSEQRTRQPTPGADTRQIAAEALTALAWALTAAAVPVALGMVALWIDRPSDFPGRYLFALLPLLTASLVLWFKADTLKQKTVDRPMGGDWYRENEL
jgi:hypothetical protein